MEENLILQEELQSIISELTYHRLQEIVTEMYRLRRNEVRMPPYYFIVHYSILSHIEQVYYKETGHRAFFYNLNLIGAVNIPINTMVCL